MDQVVTWGGWYSIAGHCLEQCGYAPCLSTWWDGCLPCSRGGKLGPHKEEPALTLMDVTDTPRGAPFQTNKR